MRSRRCGSIIQHNQIWERQREHCEILAADVRSFDPFHDLQVSTQLRLRHQGLDLLAGGFPCPPFSQAGKQLGKDDERDLFPRMLELVQILRTRAVMIENVRGITDSKFASYRQWIVARLQGDTYIDDEGRIVNEVGLGYTVSKWGVLEASDFGVPQLRPRAILVAFRNDVPEHAEFEWPTATHDVPVRVAESLEESMREFSPTSPDLVRR